MVKLASISIGDFGQFCVTLTFLCHLDFSDKKSERAKDMHLLKRLMVLLRSREVEPGKRCMRAIRMQM